MREKIIGLLQCIKVKRSYLFLKKRIITYIIIIIFIIYIDSNLHILYAANTTKHPATTEQSDMGWAEEKMTSDNKIEEAQQRIKG